MLLTKHYQAIVLQTQGRPLTSLNSSLTYEEHSRGLTVEAYDVNHFKDFQSFMVNYGDDELL